MEIKNNTVVQLNYKLQKDNDKGILVEDTYGKDPLTFIYGIGQMIPAFEANLKGKNPEDTFSFGIEATEAYGQHHEDAVVELPIESFKVNDEIDHEGIRPGRIITMQDNTGQRHTGKIIKSELTAVTVDFNHPMAGQNLFFSGEILSVRNATESELDHGHVHGPGGHQH
jgi:FKBP-type peptidyl-prolyl cis-trans isomerase SlyD